MTDRKGREMKIIIGNDHASPEMKRELVKYLNELGHEVINFGVDTSESCNYPEIGEKWDARLRQEKRTAAF